MARTWQWGWLLAVVGIGFAGSWVSRVQAADLEMAGSSLDTVAAEPISEVWEPASAEETDRFWDYVLQSPLGIAALNQLAIEGFINPTCERTLYIHSEYGGFQTLLQIDCPDPQGVSIARAYDEVRVTFNRFEDNIEDFSIERVYAE
jgi:hypothetical protein